MRADDRDFDEVLERLFEEAREPLAAGEFLADVERRLRILRRRARARRILGAGLLGACLAAATPHIAHESLRFSAYVSEAVPGLGDALLAPAGGVCSLLFAFWMLRRVGLLGR
jgi:hypothetical protein